MKNEIIKAAASAYEDMFGTDGTKYGEDYYNKIHPQPIENKYEIQNELIDVLYSQVVDLMMMSKIELGDDVIKKINELKDKLK